VHRMGQAQPVLVVHLLTTGSIEERVWETLKLKKSLFAGVFDSPTAEVSFAALGRKTVLQAVKEIFADQPGRPKAGDRPTAVQGCSAAVRGGRVPQTRRRPHPRTPPAPAAQQSAGAQPAGEQPGGVQPASAPSGFEQAAAGLIETGMRFLESLAAVAQSAQAGGSHGPAEGGLSSLISRDPRTNAPVLSIPLPPSLDQDRIMRAIGAVLGAFGRSA